MSREPITVENARFLRKSSSWNCWELGHNPLALAFSPGNRHLAIGMGWAVSPSALFGQPVSPIPADVSIADCDTGRIAVRVPQTGSEDLIEHLAYSIQGRYLAFRGIRSLGVWDTVDAELVLKRPWGDKLRTLIGFRLLDEKELLFLTGAHGLQAIDPSDWGTLLDCEQQGLRADDIQPSDWKAGWVDSRSQVKAFVGEVCVTVRDARLGTTLSTLEFARNTFVESLAFNIDGELLAIGLETRRGSQTDPDDDDCVSEVTSILWDWKQGVQLANWDDIGTSVVFSPDGSRLALASMIGVEVWECQ